MLKNKKGFTMIEILIVVALMGILLMISIPSLKQARDLNFKNLANTSHKVILNAIDFWIKDNANPSQRPANFESKNSQGNTVADYISNGDIFNITNLRKNGHGISTVALEEGKRQISVTFDKGVLKTAYVSVNSGGEITKEEVAIVYGVYDLDSTNNTVKGYDEWVARKYIITGEYEEVVK